MTDAPVNLLDQLLTEVTSTAAGGGNGTSYLKGGKTILFFVRDPRTAINDTDNKGGVFAPTVEVYEGEERRKAMMLALVVTAADPSGLAHGWNGDYKEARDDVRDRAAGIASAAGVATVRRIVPLSLGVKLHKDIMKTLAATVIVEDGKVEYPLVEMDPTTGALTFGKAVLPFVIERTGQQKKTEYSATMLPRMDATLQAFVAGAKAALPLEVSLMDAATDYAEYQRGKGAKAAPKADAAQPSPEALDFSALL